MHCSQLRREATVLSEQRQPDAGSGVPSGDGVAAWAELVQVAITPFASLQSDWQESIGAENVKFNSSEGGRAASAGVTVTLKLKAKTANK